MWTGVGVIRGHRVSNSRNKHAAVVGFFMYQDPGAESLRSQSQSSHIYGRVSVSRSHLAAGVLIWFVTSHAGGPIHIKLIGRNPLGGNVGTDAHGAHRLPVSAV